MVEIYKLKKGDLFKLKETSKIIYVYDGYNRSTNRYTGYKFLDVCDWREFKKCREVFIDFEYEF